MANDPTSGAFSLSAHYLLASTEDPSAVPTFAFKGTLLLYIPSAGAPALFQKADDGSTINWGVVGGGGGAVTSVNGQVGVVVLDTTDIGTPVPAGAVIFSDGAIFTGDETSFFWEAATKQLLIGTDVPAAIGGGTDSLVVGSSTGGTLQSNDGGTFVLGVAFTGGIIASNGSGCIVYGVAENGGSIQANSSGSLTFGKNDGGIIETGADGALARGNVTLGNINAGGRAAYAGGEAVNDAGAIIIANSIAAWAHGISDGAGSTIMADGDAAMAWGKTETGGTIQSVGDSSWAVGHSLDTGDINSAGSGSIAFGHAENAGSTVLSTNQGSAAFGFAIAGGQVRAEGDGAFTFGYTQDAGVIQSTAEGSFAWGRCRAGLIRATSEGSFAWGVTTSGTIEATGNGSFAGGVSSLGTTTASGVGAFAMGDAIVVSASYAASFGHNNNVASFASFVVGRNATTGGTPVAWVSTEPLIYAADTLRLYELSKDGRVTTTASHVNDAISTRAASSGANARVNRLILVETLVGAIQIDLPVGEHGLEMIIKDRDGNAGANNITITAQAGESIEGSLFAATINSGYGARHFIFDTPTLTWYVINRIG